MSSDWGAASAILPSAHVAADAPDALAVLSRALGPGPFALVVLFLSPDANVPQIVAAARVFGAPVIGCTTAGELTARGYDTGQILALAYPEAYFAAKPLLIPDLDQIKADDLIGQMMQARQGLAAAHPDWGHEFACLLVDGLSVREDVLAMTLAAGMGPVPLFGGSAGDGTRFAQTFVIWGDQVLQNAAVVALFRTVCRLRVFSIDHLLPTHQRMVVTRADPERRIVHRINDEPAAQEYARILGLGVGDLGAFVFAAHPVVVRIGGKHHVRAIRQRGADDALAFYAAIDEGVVLTLAEPDDMVAHLGREFAQMATAGPPAAIFACDCILRRLEAEGKQMTGAISNLLRQNKVVGFSTYGEQNGALHVNQTMTGVAFWPPDATL